MPNLHTQCYLTAADLTLERRRTERRSPGGRHNKSMTEETKRRSLAADEALYPGQRQKKQTVDVFHRVNGQIAADLWIIMCGTA